MVDFVIKLGGSLLYNIPQTKLLINKLLKENSNIVLSVGSGHLGESFKEFINSNKIELSFEAAIKCWSNIQSINANIVTGINSSVSLSSNLKDIDNILLSNKLPIIDTIFFHHYLKELELQTSDIRSAVLSKLLNCKKLIIITDVGGIYDEDPKSNVEAKKIKSLNASQLISMGRTSVDNGLAEKLIEYNITSYVIGAENFIISGMSLVNFINSQGTIIYPI